jgi:RNA polymerase binding protein RbpA
MRTVNYGAVQGTRVGAGPTSDPQGRGLTVAKVVVIYHCANGHRTTVPLICTATPPPQWKCRVCSQPAGLDPLDPPPGSRATWAKQGHLGCVKSRRSAAEGDALMAESLARRDHPEEFNVWAGPAGGRPDRNPRRPGVATG